MSSQKMPRVSFKVDALAAALAGLGMLGTPPALAVNVSANGLGQVLLYPYYTTQETPAGVPYGAMLSLVNSTPSAKAVRVRFLEGRNSREVLDFNLFLSPRDVWTAAVLPTGVGAGVATADRSCTLPVVSNSPTAPTAFVNAFYAGDGAGDGLERTKEGYIEVIEMGVPLAATVVKSVTHVNGVPPCTGLATLNAGTAMGPPTGGLFGGITLINVLVGTDYTAEAVALDAFRTSGRYDLPGDAKPNLTEVDPPIASMPDDSINVGGTIRSTGWKQPVDAVSAVLMQSNIHNEFVLDADTHSGTDWVLTMPTKRYYYVGDEVQYLYASNKHEGVGAVEWPVIDFHDREEFGSTLPPEVNFDPPRPGSIPWMFWDVSVLSFRGANVLGSGLRYDVRPFGQLNNGWADAQFPIVPSNNPAATAPARVLVSTSTQLTSLTGTAQTGVATFIGLPIIGFAVQSFNNGTLTDSLGRAIQSSYGGNFAHRGKRTMVFAPGGIVAP